MKIYIFVLTLVISLSSYNLYAGSNGKITFVKGTAYILVYSNSFKPTQARLNQKVSPQDIVKTDKGAVVKVQLADGSTVTIKDESRVQFAYVSKKSQRIDVGTGGVLSKVNKLSSQKGFNVSTPSSVAGVRGTKFVVEYDEKTDKNSLDVYEGQVMFSHEKEYQRLNEKMQAGSAITLSDKDATVIKRTANQDTLNKYEALVKEAAATISGWELN